MNNRLRRVLFWLHLVSGVAVGLVVAMMSATGAALAFEAQVRDWAERDSRIVTVPPSPVRLPLDELLRRVEAARPRVPVSAVLIPADPAAAVRVSLGREDGVHVDPYTGEVRPLAGQAARRRLGALVRWHRYLGAAGDGRDLGKAITGVANASFLFLAMSGLVLWWPRRWTASALRATLWFRRGLGGRARDFNWHNVLGFWSLPVLIVITVSGLMISYRPVSNLIYTLAGEKPPAGSPPPVALPPAAPGTRPLPLETLLASARATVPGWSTMTVRPTGVKPQAMPVTVKAPGTGPRFSSVTLTYDPFSGRLLKDERFGDLGPGRRVRSWLRFLHTGEALGWGGQLVAGIVSTGVLLMVWTGLAMALHRFRARARRPEVG